MTQTEDALHYIQHEQHELSLLGGIGALLGWDQMTYMPTQAITERADQMALLSRHAHERLINDTFYHHIHHLNQPTILPTLTDTDQYIATRLKQDVDKARKIPPSFTEKLSKTTALAYQAWDHARTHNTYQEFAPHLQKILDLEHEYCDLARLPGPLYNTLLDDYEEGMTTQTLTNEFHALRTHLTTLLNAITTTTRYQKQQPLTDTITLTHQQALSTQLLTLLTMPSDQTRLDVSTHPFTTTLGDHDVRITTNYERDGPLFAFYSTIHETGHALYELGLPHQGPYKDTVIDDAPSLGLHESQSRFWENMIARNQHFWTYFLPIFQHTTHHYTTTTLDQWYHDINQVHPSLIRIEADELTYCLHVILRFELELALIDEKLTVQELPDAWNQKMHDLLGITPTTDTDGVLQDMHWSGGDFGYFPTYAIGSIYAAQLYTAIQHDHPDLQTNLITGHLTPILTWLRHHIHQYGRLYNADDIIKRACGKGLDSHTYVNYLKNKYYDLYDI